MGLADRRAIEEYKEKSFPKLLAEIHEAAGYEVPIEVDWSQLAEEDMGHMYEENLTKVYFEPLVEGLKKITVDEMGRQALKKQVSKIAIGNATGNYYGSAWAKLEGGVLVIDHKPNSNVSNGDERVDGLVSELEAKL